MNSFSGRSPLFLPQGGQWFGTNPWRVGLCSESSLSGCIRRALYVEVIDLRPPQRCFYCFCLISNIDLGCAQPIRSIRLIRSPWISRAQHALRIRRSLRCRNLLPTVTDAERIRGLAREWLIPWNTLSYINVASCRSNEGIRLQSHGVTWRWVSESHLQGAEYVWCD